MSYTLKQLRYFLAVAEHGAVSVASEKLHISQPAISIAISQLEEILEVQLFIRHHAIGVSLTPAGTALLAHAKGILSYADDIKSQLHEHSTAMSGAIYLGYFSVLGPMFVPKLIHQFRKRHPGIEFKLVEGNLEEVSNALLTGVIETAIIYDLGQTGRLYTQKLTELRPTVVLPARHRLSKRENVGLNDLAEEPYVLLDLPHSREYFESIFERFKHNPTIRHRTPSFEMVRSLVANGEGYSILNLTPKASACYDGSKLATVPLRNDDSSLSLVIAQAENVKLAKRTAVFIEFCKQHFESANGT